MYNAKVNSSSVATSVTQDFPQDCTSIDFANFTTLNIFGRMACLKSNDERNYSKHRRCTDQFSLYHKDTVFVIFVPYYFTSSISSSYFTLLIEVTLMSIKVSLKRCIISDLTMFLGGNGSTKTIYISFNNRISYVIFCSLDLCSSC